jgi:hypothetical protein
VTCPNAYILIHEVSTWENEYLFLKKIPNPMVNILLFATIGKMSHSKVNNYGPTTGIEGPADDGRDITGASAPGLGILGAGCNLLPPMRAARRRYRWTRCSLAVSSGRPGLDGAP